MTKIEVDFLILFIIMLLNTFFSFEDMTIIFLMVFLMFWRLCRIIRVNRLNRISFWFRIVFMDFSYFIGNLFYNVRREKFLMDDLLFIKII